MANRFNNLIENMSPERRKRISEKKEELYEELALQELRRSEEHTSELQSHSFISYAVFCLKKKTAL